MHGRRVRRTALHGHKDAADGRERSHAGPHHEQQRVCMMEKLERDMAESVAIVRAQSESDDLRLVVLRGLEYGTASGA